MRISSSVKSGLALGAVLGGILGSVACTYILMPNFTSAPYDSSRRIEVYECFLKVPKNENMKWIQISRKKNPFNDDSLLLVLVLSGDNVDDNNFLSLYARQIEGQKDFENVQIDWRNKVIQYTYKSIVGSIRVKNENGCTVTYRIGE